MLRGEKMFNIHKLKMRRNPNGDYAFDIKFKEGFEIFSTVVGARIVKITVKRKGKENGKEK